MSSYHYTTEDEGVAQVTFGTDAEREQFEILMLALKVYSERNELYKDNWKRMGWRGQLIRIRERSERLWDSLWDADYSLDSIAPTDMLDDGIDLINFACFLVRAVRDRNRDGSWW